LLKKSGVDVIVAENGQVAVDLVLSALREAGKGDSAEQEPFDVILMDMQMPVMDGYEATRRLRQEGYRGSIIALTAHAMIADRHKCLNAGCNEYLAKPIARHTLLNTVASHLGKRQQKIQTRSSATPEDV
jgi:CheY-like chemotaxis protein